MNGEDTNGLLRIVIGLIVLLLVAGIVFVVYRTGKHGVNNSLKQVDQLNTSLNESRYTDYEGQIVMGSQVISLLSNYKNDTIGITVNGFSYNYNSPSDAAGLADSNKIASDTNNQNIGKAQKRGESNYISPSAEYTCTIIRDSSNNEIVRMDFTPAP